MTLWPISMLSRIFDSERAAVPASQAGGRNPTTEQAAAGDLEAALDLDHAADVVDVALAAVVDHALADRVELGPEGVELLGGELDLPLLSAAPWWRWLIGMAAVVLICLSSEVVVRARRRRRRSVPKRRSGSPRPRSRRPRRWRGS